MQISQFLDFCEKVISMYGNLEVVVYSDTDENDFSLFNVSDVQLIEIPVSRFGYKSRLALGISLGKDIRFEEDMKIMNAAKEKKKNHLTLVK